MNVLIVCNCITQACEAARRNQGYGSAAARKKIMAMSEILEKKGHCVDISSSSYSKYANLLFVENISEKIRVIHSPTIGFWGISSVFKKTVHTLFCMLWIVFHPRRYDRVIFYNYHFEYSIPAIFARLISGLGIASKLKTVMDYEDGLFLDRGYRGIIYRTWEKFIYKITSRYLLVNRGLKNRIEEKTASLKKYAVINGFIDDGLLSKNRECTKGPVKRLVFSGNFSHGFGFEQLIQYIENMDNNIEFSITGSGTKEEIDKVLQLTKGRANVNYYGYLQEDDFNRLMDKADGLVLLNDENSEFNQTNFPSKLYDYLSRNKFVITSRNHILSDYYDLNNIILLENFPDDIKQIGRLSIGRQTDYGQIRALARKNQDLLETLLT